MVAPVLDPSSFIKLFVNVCAPVHVLVPDRLTPVAGACHVAAVPLVAVNTCPVVGAVADDTFTVVVAELSAFAEADVDVGVCHVAVVPLVAISTCPFVGAVAAETDTVVVADFKADA